MKKKIFTFILIISVPGILFLTTSSCKKNRDCKAIITVNDSVGNPISGVLVRLFATKPNNIVNVTETTAENGQANFFFALEAILFISAAKSDTDTIAAGYIQLKPGETVEKVVVYKH